MLMENFEHVPSQISRPGILVAGIKKFRFQRLSRHRIYRKCKGLILLNNSRSTIQGYFKGYVSIVTP